MATTKWSTSGTLNGLSGRKPNLGIKETITDLNDLQAGGNVRHIGVSKFPVNQFRAAERASGIPNLTNQIKYEVEAPV